MTERDEFVARRIEEIKYGDNWLTRNGQYPDRTWGGRTELIEPLIELLTESDDETTRERAARAASYVGDDRAIDPLVAAAERDPSPEVRRAAVWSLRRFDDPDAVRAVRRIAATESDGEIRWRAGRVLAAIDWAGKPDYAVELLREGDDRTWEGFTSEIGKHYVEGREAVFEAFGDCLGDENVDEARLIEGLGQFEGADGILLDALDRDDPAVREAAIEGLGRQGERDAIDRLRDLAANDPVTAVRASAVDALGDLAKQYEMIDVLDPFVDDPDPAVRRSAVSRLRSASRPANVPVLVDALSDPDPEVRASAAWGLKVAGHPGAVPDLLDACSDEDPEVRETALLALEWIAGDVGQCDATGFALFEDETVPATPGHDERPHSSDRARRILREALTDPDPDVRAQAVATIGATRQPDGARLLATVVREWDDADLARQATAQLRKVTHYDVAVDALRAALDHESAGVRAAAVDRARSLPSEEIEPALRAALHDESATVRRNAIETARTADVDLTEAIRARLDCEDDAAVRFAAKTALGAFGEA